MSKLSSTVDRLNSVLSEDNVKSIGETLAHLEKATGALGNQSDAIEKTLAGMPDLVASLKATSQDAQAGVADLRKALQDFDKVAANVNLLLADIGPQDAEARKALAGRTPSELRQTLEGMRTSLARLNAASDGFAALVAENRRPLRQFTDTGLAELSQTIRELRSLTSNLNVIATKLERDPMGYVFGGKQGYTPR
jgi:phospholipid/cholesterol/gamma-HCH transport system substrate-binding protein